MIFFIFFFNMLKEKIPYTIICILIDFYVRRDMIAIVLLNYEWKYLLLWFFGKVSVTPRFRRNFANGNWMGFCSKRHLTRSILRSGIINKTVKITPWSPMQIYRLFFLNIFSNGIRKMIFSTRDCKETEKEKKKSSDKLHKIIRIDPLKSNANPLTRFARSLWNKITISRI